MERNFYRAIGMPEYERYLECEQILSGREWVELGLQREGGFSFHDIKRIVDTGGWKEGVNYGEDLPRDVIVKVNGELGVEFGITKINWIPQRYENKAGIDMERVEIVYDPRSTILTNPLLLSSGNIPELDEFVRLSHGRLNLEVHTGKFIID